MLRASDVAEYFLSLVNTEDGEGITNLKLQKLIYYAQGFHLAISDQPLFSEDIEAWVHGPVVPEIYQAYKQYGGGPIPIPESLDLAKYSEPEMELLDEIHEVFGQFSAWKLRNMTHVEPPWADTPQGEVISHAAMQRYFKTRLA